MKMSRMKTCSLKEDLLKISRTRALAGPTLVAAAGFLCQAAHAANFPGLPTDGPSHYIECSVYACSDASLKNMVLGSAMYSGKNGTNYYVIGNLSTGTVQAYSADVVIDVNNNNAVTSGATTTVTTTRTVSLTPITVPSFYSGNFPARRAFATSTKKISISIPAGANSGEFATASQFDPWDEGWAADIAVYLQGQIGKYVDGETLLIGEFPITVTFSDGSTAQFMFLGSMVATGFQFNYIPGTHKDSHGNKIPDRANQDVSNVNVEQRNGPPPSQELSPSWNYITIEQVGVVNVGPVTPLNTEEVSTGGTGGGGVIIYYCDTCNPVTD